MTNTLGHNSRTQSVYDLHVQLELSPGKLTIPQHKALAEDNLVYKCTTKRERNDGDGDSAPDTIDEQHFGAHVSVPRFLT